MVGAFGAAGEERERLEELSEVQNVLVDKSLPRPPVKVADTLTLAAVAQTGRQGQIPRTQCERVL